MKSNELHFWLSKFKQVCWPISACHHYITWFLNRWININIFPAHIPNVIHYKLLQTFYSVSSLCDARLPISYLCVLSDNIEMFRLISLQKHWFTVKWYCLYMRWNKIFLSKRSFRKQKSLENKKLHNRYGNFL